MDEVKPWFQEGLRFKCTGCGACCTGSPGYVYLSDPDLENLARHFGLSIEEFGRRYTRLVDGQIALLDKPGSADCIFLKENKCSAYEARPVQCKTFPWWVHNLREPKDWEEAAERCEGINHPDAPLVAAETIEVQCMTYLDNLVETNFSLES
ncbi:MAG: YkgJ family cysteine cluster protein [Verrucomicrobia bacterium]|nr:YkgJ family cysteine cluster protein [Verrucomicrobiota bacterium]